MKRVISTVRCFVLVFLLVCASGCCRQDPPDAVDFYGYALLYAVTSQEQDVDKLLWIKNPGEEIEGWIRKIAQFNSEVTKTLEDAKASGVITNLKVMGLPATEQEARKLAARETAGELLLSSGMDLRLDLVITQIKALAYCADLCEALGKESQGEVLKSELEEWKNEFKQLGVEGMAMLRVKSGDAITAGSDTRSPQALPAHQGAHGKR